ncbi:cytochrome P450 4C1-like [Trichogramma pretiosum]|uniref:cytochrome P450 4C1-like n=1 Tax=Trichogramma pretiosum TaxID=7493 RepID=UPI0006C9A906|nr:cytochrome P450 4C1-like [Trichogramma pretiosum]
MQYILIAKLSSSRNDDFIEIIQKKVTILLEQIQLEINKNVKEPIDILHLTSKYSLDVVCENVLGVDLDCQRVPFNPYVEALQKLCNVSIDRYYEFLMKWDYLFYKTAKGRELMTAIDIIREFTEEIIKQRISLRKNTEEKPKCKSFLDALLDVYEEFKYESTVTIEQIREELDAYIFSAYSTTSVAISWALFALGNAQKAQARVSAEMREAAESTSSKPASIRQLLDLKYLDRVAKEVLRLYPSVPTVGRCLEKDLVLDFYFIPKGTQVDLHVYQLHHDPDVWDDPERFEPDRFLPENCNVRHSHAYAPFADGPRACLGRDQALLEMKLVLSALLAKWRVYSCLRPAEMKLRADFNLRPADDKINMYFFPVDRIAERR